MTTNNAETIRTGAEVLDTLTSNLPDAHPLRIEAAGRAKELVASLYALADAMDQPAMAADAWKDQLISLVVTYGDQRHFEVGAKDKRDAVCRSAQAFANIMAHARRRIDGES